LIKSSRDLVVNSAIKSLITEVALTPKPGLVDCLDTGAHHDMDYFTFLNSIESLAPFFYQYYSAGEDFSGDDLRDLFQESRLIGQQAEKAMMSATKGVNTHKGANFSFALLLSACGYYCKQNHLIPPIHTTDTQNILTIVQEMTRDVLKEDFVDLDKKDKLSYGEKLYLEHGITGVRGEAANGYPLLQDKVLPYIRHLTNDEPQDIRLLRCLIFIMSHLEDTNIIHRSNYTQLQVIKGEMQRLHEANLSSSQLKSSISDYNQRMIERHLSPGGSADLLALMMFFAYLEGLIQ